MKHLPLLLTITAILVAPASASAYEKPSGTFCSTAEPSRCMTVQPTDLHSVAVRPPTNNGWGYQNTGTGEYTRHGGSCSYYYTSIAAWTGAGSPRRSDTCVYIGGELVNHTIRRFLFTDIPADDIERFLPSDNMAITEYRVGGVVTESYIGVSLQAPNEVRGSGLQAYCNYYRPSYETPEVALDRTPSSVYAACGFKRRVSDPVVVAPPTTDPAVSPPSGAITVPVAAARCGTTSGVVVRSTRVLCAPARTVMGRYARTLRSPAGWSCRMVINDRGRRGSCVRKQVSKSGKDVRATVYGIWLNTK